MKYLEIIEAVENLIYFISFLSLPYIFINTKTTKNLYFFVVLVVPFLNVFDAPYSLIYTALYAIFVHFVVFDIYKKKVRAVC